MYAYVKGCAGIARLSNGCSFPAHDGPFCTHSSEVTPAAGPLGERDEEIRPCGTSSKSFFFSAPEVDERRSALPTIMTTPTSTSIGEHENAAHSQPAADKEDDLESTLPTSAVDADSALLQFPEGGAKAWLAVLGGCVCDLERASL